MQAVDHPGFAVGTAFAHGSGMEQPIPTAGDQVPVSAAFQVAKLFPEAVQKAALVFAEFPATETRDKYAVGYPKAGWKFLDCEQIYDVSGESDWKPIASHALKTCGVEAVVWVGSPDPNLENLLNASKQVGFAPKAWLTDPNQYTASFAKWNGQNGGAADNVYVRMTGVPFELADQSPAVQQYTDLVSKSHGTIGLLGEQAASSFLLWATGVKACGSAVTAKCGRDSRRRSRRTGRAAACTSPPIRAPTRRRGAACAEARRRQVGQGASPPPTSCSTATTSIWSRGITTPAADSGKLNAERVDAIRYVHARLIPSVPRTVEDDR